MVKDDAIAGYIADESAYKTTLESLDSSFRGEGERSLENTMEMGRQFREMQSAFNSRIEDLQAHVSQSKKEIEKVREEIEKTAVEKDEIIMTRDEEIRYRSDVVNILFVDMVLELNCGVCNRVSLGLAFSNSFLRSLTLKMETMAFEFADMLKETLDKMSQRIEVSNTSWVRDTSKPPLMNRLKEFSLTDS